MLVSQTLSRSHRHPFCPVVIVVRSESGERGKLQEKIVINLKENMINFKVNVAQHAL